MNAMSSNLFRSLCLFVAGVWVGVFLTDGGMPTVARAEYPVSAPARASFGVGTERVVSELRQLNRTVRRIDQRMELGKSMVAEPKAKSDRSR